MDGRRNGMRAAEIMGRSQLGVFESGPELLGGAVNNKARWLVCAVQLHTLQLSRLHLRPL